MRRHRTPDVPAVKHSFPSSRRRTATVSGDGLRPRQLADGTIGVSLPHLPGLTRSALQFTNDFEESRRATFQGFPTMLVLFSRRGRIPSQLFTG